MERLSNRQFFLVVAVGLLLLATNRFDGDLWAFLWSMSITLGVVWIGE